MAEGRWQDSYHRGYSENQSHPEENPGTDADNFNLHTETLLLAAKTLHRNADVMHRKRRKFEKKQKPKKLKERQMKYNDALSECKDALIEISQVLQKTADKEEHGFDQYPKHKRERALSANFPKVKTRIPIPEVYGCEKCSSNELKKEKLQQDFDTAKRELRQQEENMNKVLQQNESLSRDLKMEKEAKDDALRRLSSMASSKLRDNNPNISDLSDQNRPTKIAEKMSEVYDNEWTDAFDSLEKNSTEVKIIETLLSTLMTVYEKCQELANEHFFERVQNSILFPNEVNCSPSRDVILPDQLKQQIKEFRKTRAVHVIKEIEKVVATQIQIPNSQTKEIKRYLACCVEISWLCVVQDPPVVLSSATANEFDTNRFKDYTKRGPYIEYVVWPALLLHENGPLLSKGVAQGCHSLDNRKNIPAKGEPRDIKHGRSRQRGQDDSAEHVAAGLGQTQSIGWENPSFKQTTRQKGQVQSYGRSSGSKVLYGQSTNKSQTMHVTRVTHKPVVDYKSYNRQGTEEHGGQSTHV